MAAEPRRRGLLAVAAVALTAAVVLLPRLLGGDSVALDVGDRPLAEVIGDAAAAKRISESDAAALADLYVEHVDELAEALRGVHPDIAGDDVEGALAVLADHEEPLTRVWQATQPVIAGLVAEVGPVGAGDGPSADPLEEAAVLAVSVAQGVVDGDVLRSVSPRDGADRSQRVERLAGELLWQAQSLLARPQGDRPDHQLPASARDLHSDVAFAVEVLAVTAVVDATADAAAAGGADLDAAGMELVEGVTAWNDHLPPEARFLTDDGRVADVAGLPDEQLAPKVNQGLVPLTRGGPGAQVVPGSGPLIDLAGEIARLLVVRVPART